MTRMNALWNCKNPFQGDSLKVLTVCSAGLLRSPSVAKYLMIHKGYNCRPVGVYDYALIQIDDVLIEWADVVIFLQEEHKSAVQRRRKLRTKLQQKRCVVLNIPDNFEYCDEELMKIIENKVEEYDL